MGLASAEEEPREGLASDSEEPDFPCLWRPVLDSFAVFSLGLALLSLVDSVALLLGEADEAPP